MRTLNYADLTTMVANYRANPNGPRNQVLNWTTVPLSILDTFVQEALQANYTHIRIYPAKSDSSIVNDRNFPVNDPSGDNFTMLIAVTAIEDPANSQKIDDIIDQNNKIGYMAFGIADNIGMCPPSCGASTTTGALLSTAL